MTGASAARPQKRTKSRTRKGQRDVMINLRAPAHIRALIDRAAAAIGKTRTDFMLDSASQAAEDILLDRRLFLLDDKRYEQFVAMLDAPAAPSEELKSLMGAKAPWRA